MFFAPKGESEFDKRPFGIILEAILLFVIISLLIYLTISNNNHGYRNRGDANKKRCFSNIRQIQNAIENYNMDNTVMMKDLDLDLLINGKYIDEELIDGLKCKFKNTLDLTNDGYVYCEYHGDLQGKIKGSDLSIPVMNKKDYNKARKENRIFGLFIALIVFGIPLTHILFAKSFTKKQLNIAGIVLSAIIAVSILIVIILKNILTF